MTKPYLGLMVNLRHREDGVAYPALVVRVDTSDDAAQLQVFRPGGNYWCWAVEGAGDGQWFIPDPFTHPDAVKVEITAFGDAEPSHIEVPVEPTQAEGLAALKSINAVLEARPAEPVQ